MKKFFLIAQLCLVNWAAFSVAVLFDHRHSEEQFSWKDLVREEINFSQVIDRLYGKNLDHQEMRNFLGDTALEDAPEECLYSREQWRLVALRAGPESQDLKRFFELGIEPKTFSLRLSFQPFCFGEVFSSDTSFHVVYEFDLQSYLDFSFLWEQQLNPKSLKKPSMQDMGFLMVENVESDFSDSLLFSNAASFYQSFSFVIERIKNSRPEKIKWMSSPQGQLDWVFSYLSVEEDFQLSVSNVVLDLGASQSVKSLNLGPYDFAPLDQRDFYEKLSEDLRGEIDRGHQNFDPQIGESFALKSLEIDERVNDPTLTAHDNVSCLQCHAMQERYTRVYDFYQEGGAREFGYFFRVFGYMGAFPYISDRLLRELSIEKIWRDRSDLKPILNLI